MKFTLAQQTVYFLYSILSGVLLAVVYEITRIFRIAGVNKIWQLIVIDIIYFCYAGFATFMFALSFNNGQIRFFTLLGELAGFVLFRFTLGELTGKIYKALSGYIINICKKLSKNLKNIIKKLLKAGGNLLYNISEKRKALVKQKK